MDNKGISPLIAAVLLIAFTVAIATVIMGWMSTTTRTTTSNITGKTETAVGCSDAAVKIDHVYVTSGGSGAIVVVNTGFKDLTVNGTVYNNTGASCTGTAVSLPAGATDEVTLASCPTISPSTFEEARVWTTTCGGVGDSITSYSSTDVTIN